MASPRGPSRKRDKRCQRLRELLQLSHHFLFTGQNLVILLPAVIRIDTHLLISAARSFHASAALYQ